MANISQNIFDKTRLFRRLVFQQSKSAADYELNELQDILHEFQADTREFLGAFGFWGDAFRVEATGNPNEIKVRKGLMLTGDSVILLTEDVVLDNLTTPSGVRTDEVFLQVSIQEVGKTEYPDLINPLTGQELARRFQYKITLGVAEARDYSSYDIPAEDQFICFATLNRAVASNVIIQSEITDERTNYSATYIKGKDDDTFNLTQTGGLGFSLERGEVSVFGESYVLPSSAGSVTNESLTFIYVSGTGVLTYSTVRPLGKHLELWRVTASAGTITNAEDRRRFPAGGLTGISTRGSVTQESIRDLAPRQDSPASMRVVVEPGIGSYGTVAIDFAGGLSPTFTAPLTNPRIDLLYLDGNGILQIELGVEGSGNPPFHSGKLPIAEVTLSVGQTEITDAEIRDVRPLFNVGGSSSSMDDGPGTYVLSSGLGLGNTILKPSWTYGESFSEVTFDSTVSGGQLSWTGNIAVRFLTSSGVVSNTILGPGSLIGVADGDWIFFDINRSAITNIVLARQPGGPPSFNDNRQIFGQRIGNNFYLQGGQVLYDQKSAVYTSLGIDLNRWSALQEANSPGPANVFATINDVPVNLADLADVSVNQAAAFAGMNSPSGANVIATIADVPSSAITYQHAYYAGSYAPPYGSYGVVAGMSLTMAITGTYLISYGASILISYPNNPTLGFFINGVALEYTYFTFSVQLHIPIYFTYVASLTAGQVLDVRGTRNTPTSYVSLSANKLTALQIG